ncbi:ABC transporter permease, partial [Metallibacterium sp.]|uniref:ABC transporter permease n=1 Tax=Metallibacterium sp. TaxID=2940281 RepID=UPI00261152F3
MRFLINAATLLVLLLGLYLWIRLPWWLLLILVVLAGVAMLLTRRGRQALAVARMGVSTLPQRLGASSVILVGIAGVVGVLVALLAMSGGLAQTLRATGSNDTAIVLRAGATGELTSAMTHGDATLVAQAPGIARDAKGVPLASPELLMVVNLRKRGSSSDANVQLRGVGPLARAVHTHVRLLQGRWFKPGLRELVVGVGAEREFAGVKLGDSVRLGRQPWKVVGVFRSGDAHDSELWADADTMASTYRWGDFSVVNVRLAKPADFAMLKAALLSNPQLHVMVQTTRAYYAAQSEGVTKVIRIVGISVGVIMALGAIFGALNTMY